MARSYSVLIVDTDPQGLESLVQGFKGSDWNITVSPLIETFPMLLKASGADVVALVARQDTAKTVALLEQVQAAPGTERLSFLLLAPESDRSLLVPAPNRAFLPIPAFVADVVCASEILAATQLSTSALPDEGPTVELHIPARGPIPFVRTLCAMGRSGHATFEHGGKRGEFVFCEGGIISAHFGQWQGQPAAHHMLTWDSGLIRLQLRPVVKRPHLGQTPDQFIEDADRFRRDFEHQLKVIGPRNTVYSRPEGRSIHSSADIPSEFLPILRLCDGHRTLNDLLNESPYRLMDTVRVIERLLNIGSLTRRAHPVAARTTSAPSDTFWETARITSDSADQVTPGPYVVTAPQPEPPPALPEVDQRSTIQPRRKDRRRAGNQTLNIGAPENITAQSSLEIPKSATSSGELAQAGARDPITSTPETGAKTSGTIEIGTADRRSRTNLPTVKDRPSIVIEIQDGPTKQSPGGPSPALVVPASPTGTPTPIPAQPAPLVLPPPAEPKPVEPGQGALPTASSELPVARITGVMQVSNSGRTNRVTGTRQAVGSSIQLDASLSSDALPSPSESALPPAHTTPPLGEVIPVPGTDRPQAVESSKSTRPQTNATANLATDSPSKAHPKAAPHRAPTPIRGSVVRKATPEKIPVSGQASQPVAAATDRKSHISGAFNAVESDFFAREADLYKENEVESFRDLEEKKSTPGKGRSPSKGNRR